MYVRGPMQRARMQIDKKQTPHYRSDTTSIIQQRCPEFNNSKVRLNTVFLEQLRKPEIIKK